MAITQVTQLSDGYIPTQLLNTRYFSEHFNIQETGQPPWSPADFYITGTPYIMPSPVVEHYLFECSNTFKCKVHPTNGVIFEYQGQNLTSIVKLSVTGKPIYVCLGYDDDTQKGYISVIFEDNSMYPNHISNSTPPLPAIAYEAIKGADIPPITYNWQSVPSISGKNGILQSLVQIKEEALNDGEPVSEATVLSFDSLGNINIPSVIDEQMPVDPSDVTSVTATYLIPALENGTYEGIKLLVKKGSIPTSEQDADKVVNLDEPTSILRIDSKSVGNLDEDSHYYFMVKLIDEIGTEATSDPKDIWTSHSEGWSFDYTGSIQTFVAPKTGIYQLETWGAQGGDATDGTNSARGGYGAYAVGEVLLQQGETLYINVGGQNGYGGGGLLDPVPEEYNWIKNLNNFYSKDYSYSSSGLVPSFYDGENFYNSNKSRPMTPKKALNQFSYMILDASNMHTENSNAPVDFYYQFSDTIERIDITTGSTVTVTYSNKNYITVQEFFSNTQYISGYWTAKSNYLSSLSGETYDAYMTGTSTGQMSYEQTTFSTLNDALTYIYNHYANVNLYVDDVLWVSALT